MEVISSQSPPVQEDKDEKPKVKFKRKLGTSATAELFPDFKNENKALRFSRLFGPGKPSSLPQIWGTVRRRKRRERISDLRSDENKRESKGWVLNFAPEPGEDQWQSDDEAKLLGIVKDESAFCIGEEINDGQPRAADWRFGPAQIWYDMLNVPETGEGFNYGFKLKPKNKNEINDNEEKSSMHEKFPDDAFLLVSQLHWEDDVVWNGEDIKHKVMPNLNSKTNAAGWIPSSRRRTAQELVQPGKEFIFLPHLKSTIISSPSFHPHNSKAQALVNKIHQRQFQSDKTWYSIFPIENEELVHGRWEDDVIWDAENMETIPTPKILTLDPNDENIILGIPNDLDPGERTRTPVKAKISQPHVKKSKILLGKAGVINVAEEDLPLTPPKSPDRDPFNISNDSYYTTKTPESLEVSGNLLQHSIPATELRAPFFPTHMGPMKLRNFHRPPLKRFSCGDVAQPGSHPVFPLLKHIKKKAKQRDQERIAAGGGDIFSMRLPEDLSGKDGDLVLIEFSEEHPPLINQVGMCSKIKNYYKRKAGNNEGPPEYRYGETAYAHTSPFLGTLAYGASIQAIENNMYRAPIFEQKLPDTDFLVIRTRWQYWIREVNAVFVAGQECPLYEVPVPNSKRANHFIRDYLQVFIYRLFWECKDTPRRIKMDDVKKAFPTHSENSIRKSLKLCSTYKRIGIDGNWWIIKPDFRLPTEEEIRAIVSPEQCCAYFSMLAAEQRLKDAGYGEKFIFALQDEDDEEMQLKMDDEVKIAPWNTTRAYIQAVTGKCRLQLTGPADPTGCGEGFSYVRLPSKPTQSREQEAQPKRMVNGTDADLRRLSLNHAKALLRKFGVPEEEIKKLSRWEVIDVVRTLSTEKVKAGEKAMTKFSRGNRFSIAEHQERYKEECQRLFELQNRVLASSEVLSTDEAESSLDEDVSDIEKMGKNIEKLLASEKTSSQLSREREELERKELKKIFIEGVKEEQRKVEKEKRDEEENLNRDFSGHVLKIYRTFRDSKGKEYTRVEIVRKPTVIDTYLKIRSTGNEAFIKRYALDKAQNNDMKREKQRIQEQLRRIKKNQERDRSAAGKRPQVFRFGSRSVLNPLRLSRLGTTNRSDPHKRRGNKHHRHHRHGRRHHHSKRHHHKKRKLKELKGEKSDGGKAKLKIDSQMKCGSCGNIGHMRTNRSCPNYPLLPEPVPYSNVAMTEEQEEELEKQILNVEDDEDLVRVDGTKVKLSGKLLKHADEIKRETLLLRVPKEAMHLKKRRKPINEPYCDYLQPQQKLTKRVRTDPLVVLSTILESILKELRGLPDIAPFLFPVNAKAVPDYYKIIVRPMDLETIRENLRRNKYTNREEFLKDVNQIVENSTLYNGAKSAFTITAKRMLERCVDRLYEKEEKLIKLEKAIDPSLNWNKQSEPELEESFYDINADLEVSESDEENVNNTKNIEQPQMDVDDDDLWF